jgi:glucokinase
VRAEREIPEALILAGDVGGTHTRLALLSEEQRDPNQREIYPSAGHGGLEEIVGTFLAAHPAKLDAATFGVAGPVRDGRTQAVNLAWPVDAASLAQKLELDPARVSVINDLEANAWGLEALGEDDLVALNHAEAEPGGTVALISAGTGLGEAFVTYGPYGPAAQASEGGHVDFAPRDELQAELLRWLTARGDHVSYERVCSGIGLANIYAFLRGRASEPEPEWLAAERAGGAEGAAITRAGLERRDATASGALDLMLSVYGAQAGNLALTVLAVGGVYLGGGIAPRVVERLKEGGFMAAFTDKGRMSAVLERIPVFVILNDLTALLGAGRHAAAQAFERDSSV